MMKNDLEGIVLRKTDFREADAILSVLTHDGKVSILARGVNKIKSKNAYGCQLFTYSRFYLLDSQSQSSYKLKNLECIKSYRHIRENLLKQTIAGIFVEVLDKVELDELTFKLEDLLFCLEKLEDNEDEYCLLALFLAQITNQIGLNPNVEACCHCESEKGIMAFSIQDGGFICSNCYKIEQHQKLNLQDLKRIRAVYKAEFSNYESLLTLGPWNYGIIDLQMRFLREYGGFIVKSVEFLECLQATN